MARRVKVEGAPDTIYLVLGDLDEPVHFRDLDEVAWCEDKQFDSDLKYKRVRTTRRKPPDTALWQRMAEALTKYGTHTRGCARWSYAQAKRWPAHKLIPPCTCGFATVAHDLLKEPS